MLELSLSITASEGGASLIVLLGFWSRHHMGGGHGEGKP